jgi:hypothetical protein
MSETCSACELDMHKLCVQKITSKGDVVAICLCTVCRKEAIDV